MLFWGLFVFCPMWRRVHFLFDSELFAEILEYQSQFTSTENKRTHYNTVKQTNNTC